MAYIFLVSLMKVVGSSNRVHSYTLYLTRVGMYVDICPVYVKQKYVHTCTIYSRLERKNKY